jgi:dihydropteroate synthase
VTTLRIGNRDFATGKNRTYIMGILNVTPDSFYDGGHYQTADDILRRGEEMLNEGVDIIDIGGESTRPGYQPLGVEEECERITTAIELIKTRFDIPISLDTSKATVAKAGIAAGAEMINDIWGLKADPQMAAVISEAGVACCLAHNCETVLPKQDVIIGIGAGLRESLALAHAAGISGEKIILDPGIGFGKDYQGNMIALANLSELKKLGFPCLLGASRKSVIGLTLDLPVEERLEGTIATTVMGVLSGYSFVRVHDVAANKRAIKMTEDIKEYQQ